jgi:predicted O-methyltransferase YrrM
MKALLHRIVRSRAVKPFIERFVVPPGDLLLAPFVLLAACLLKLVRRVGVYRMTISRAILRRVGVFPIRDHYYEPMFDPRHLRRPLDEERRLPGIDFNLPGQLELLGRFDYAAELAAIPRTGAEGSYHYENPNFGAGDAEYLYSAIRHFKPARILEIGSGYSTLMMQLAVRANQAGDPAYRCRVTCVEPYEMEWLDRTAGIEVLRQPVELLDERRVAELRANDILFIDSSHILRPQGDVVREYLELLPLLAPGVLVHIHDICTPRDYPAVWVVDQVRLYNEQYLVEALLTGGTRFGIIGALNLLAHRHREKLAEKFPVLREQGERCEPGSLWLVSR